MPTYHWERESIERIACTNTRDHVYDATARECLHSNVSGMNTPPRPVPDRSPTKPGSWQLLAQARLQLSGTQWEIRPARLAAVITVDLAAWMSSVRKRMSPRLVMAPGSSPSLIFRQSL